MKTRLTPQQKEVVEQLKLHPAWRIRYGLNEYVGGLEAYLSGAPHKIVISLRVFDSLRKKQLIEEDGSSALRVDFSF